MLGNTADRLDRRILELIQEDARISNAELAAKIGLSPSPCWRRVRALEERGVIRRYVTLVTPEAIGLPVNVWVHVTLEEQVERRLEHFESAIVARPEVMECYLMTGESDYLLRVVVPDIAAYDRFYKELISEVKLTDVSSSFAMEEIKYTTALPLATELQT